LKLKIGPGLLTATELQVRLERKEKGGTGGEGGGGVSDKGIKAMGTLGGNRTAAMRRAFVKLSKDEGLKEREVLLDPKARSKVKRGS